MASDLRLRILMFHRFTHRSLVRADVAMVWVYERYSVVAVARCALRARAGAAAAASA